MKKLTYEIAECGSGDIVAEVLGTYKDAQRYIKALESETGSAYYILN